MAKFASLPGFRDFYPEELAVRAHITQVWRQVARRYGFQEYDGPPLEPTDLYVEKSGPEIVQQLYHFTDKGGRDVALRPEMTPTLARMVGARAAALRKPIRWFAIPQLFRYERTQRGRLREHFQLNVDIVGEAEVAADAELLAVAIDTLRAFGLTEQDFVARVSDRRLLRALLLQVGVPAERLPLVYNIVDKLERESASRIVERLTTEAALDRMVIDRTLAIFEHRAFEAVCSAYAGRAADIDEELQCIGSLLRSLGAMGLADYVRFDLSVVRGLAYYTGMVFELFDTRGELRAIAGGGRYDNLLGTIAGVDLPAIGFGMGDVVLRELLAQRDLLPTSTTDLDYYLVAVTPEDREAVFTLAHTLRDAGHSVEYALRHQAVGRQLKAATAAGARQALIVGPTERAEGVAVGRTLATGEESRVPFDHLTRPG